MMKGIDDLKIELNKYLSLENNWDGYDGLPPKNGTVQDCLKFINQLEGDDFYLPKSMLSSSGVFELLLILLNLEKQLLAKMIV